MKNRTVEDKRCLEVARIIRSGVGEIKFRMSTYKNDCGSAGCIAGHAIYQYKRDVWDGEVFFHNTLYFETARELLGLSKEKALEMFVPWDHGGPESSAIDRDRAARTLENFVQTRDVNWYLKSK